MNAPTVVEQIRRLDGVLLLSAERLRKYRAAGNDVSVGTQQAVINRQLDARLELMRERDR